MDGFRSDHLKNASDNMIVVLTMLINCMLIHGYNPSQLLRCTIISIPKDRRGSLKRSDNYRGISQVNSICKLVDILIICNLSLNATIQRYCVLLSYLKLSAILPKEAAMYMPVYWTPVRHLIK